MDTTTWIVSMCDGNEDLKQLLLRALREQGKELVIAMMGVIQRPAWEEALAKFKEFTMDVFEPETVSFLEWQQAWQRNCNNYRKIHRLPLIRRLKCRWRPRESRRVLYGMSADTVVIDELYECV